MSNASLRRMCSVALGYPRNLGRLRSFARVLLVVALGSAVGHFAAAQPAVVAPGKYSRGACQLRLLSVTQERASQARNAPHIVSMQFQLEFPQGEKAQFAAQVPPGFYLNNVRSPLLNAEVEPGKNLAKNAHTGTAEGNNGVVTIDDLDVGARRDRIRNVEIEVALARVTEWEQKKFEGLNLGGSDFLQCGPFEFRVTGDSQQVRLSVWAYPQFKADHEAYRKRMPLKFVGPSFAMEELKLTDKAGRSPTSTGIAGGGAGASVATYSSWRSPAGDAPEGEEIAYPVTLSLRLPAKFETEVLKFRFDQIALPAPK